MKVLIVGAGPAGLSFAALMAQADNSHEITVIERNAANVRPGFGITLRSDGISLLGLDSMDIFQHLEGRAFRFRGEVVVDLPYPASIHGITLSRAALLNTLIGICSRSGVRIQFRKNAAELREWDFEQFDLVVAADGGQSHVRKMFQPAFAPTVEYSQNRYAWFGANVPLNRLTIMLNDRKGVLLGWGYMYTRSLSTLIVECTDECIKNLGFDCMTASQTADALGEVFGPDLGGARVICGTNVQWTKFPAISCERLQHRNIVLIGDAAHTTHFSQGFGTLFAFDDALALQSSLTATRNVADALDVYQAGQMPKIANFQGIATRSRQWSERLIEAAERAEEGQIWDLINERWLNNSITSAPGARDSSISRLA